ncbi:MAG: hypothetical protein HRU01_20075 [Myxococcales bacterium]|nr:hypothetical protein [Myxococcales bacterium]
MPVERSAPYAAIIALLLMACGPVGWSDDDRSDFMSNCLTNVRLEEEHLRDAICSCWLERTQSKYSYAEANSGNQTIQADFVDIGKVCSSEQGVRAHLPGED